MRKCWVHFSRPLLLNRPWASLGLRIEGISRRLQLNSVQHQVHRPPLTDYNNPPFEIIFYFKASIEPK